MPHRQRDVNLVPDDDDLADAICYGMQPCSHAVSLIDGAGPATHVHHGVSYALAHVGQRAVQVGAAQERGAHRQHMGQQLRNPALHDAVDDVKHHICWG